MTLWMVRAGRHGESEGQFIEEQRIHIGFGFSEDVSKLASRDAVIEKLREGDPSASLQKLANHASQLWTFAHVMKIGDWVVVPFKSKRAINIAEITGTSEMELGDPDDPVHSRSVKWIAQDIPRTAFEQDILYSFGGLQTVYAIRRNDAERRIKELVEGWTANENGRQELERENAPLLPASENVVAEDLSIDLEAIAADQIEAALSGKFRGPDGYDLERLVRALLRAQGYTVHHSRKGKDKGVDLLAAPGPLGFGTPRICVQVKSGSGKTDRPTLDQLIGTMQNVQAEQGLLVSWGGFTKDVEEEEAAQFFRVRLWGKQELIDELLDNYEELDSDIKLELPLKRIWAMAREPE